MDILNTPRDTDIGVHVGRRTIAILSEANRRAEWAKFMSDSSSTQEEIGITKQDLRGALDAVDVWVEANSGAINQALPVVARSGLTNKQKDRLFLQVVQRRFEVA